MPPRSSLPLITVAGASSKQGRSVAASLLDSGRYRVRALTRSADSAPMRELARRGAEIVVAPLQAGRQAELAAAMHGSHGAFLMTPPVAPVPPPGRPELALGLELADAALAAGVEHVVWSSLENVEARTGGTCGRRTSPRRPWWRPTFARCRCAARSSSWPSSTATSSSTTCRDRKPMAA